MSGSRQHALPSGHVTIEAELSHPRAALWEVLGDPELYPRFFPRVSGCVRVSDEDTDDDLATARYHVTVAAARGKARSATLRTVTRRPAEKLVLASTDDSAMWVSVRLADSRPGKTKVTIVASPVSAATRHTSWGRATLRRRARVGLRRIGDYLGGVSDGPVRHGRRRWTTPLRIAVIMVRSGVISSSGPIRGARQLMRLYGWGFNLAGGYAAAAARNPARIALADDHGQVTFADLHVRTTRLAASLTERGVGPGATVALLARNNAAAVECMVACNKVGAQLVLLNTGLAARQIERLVHQHAVHMLFADDEFEPLIQYLPEAVPRVSTARGPGRDGRPTIDELITTAPSITVSPPSTSGRQIVLTSGTSGTPKGARRPAPKGWRTLAAFLSRVPLRVGDRILIAAPVFHSWGLGALQISTPIRATVVLQEKFDPHECLRALAGHKCTVLVAVPIMLHRILTLPEAERAQFDLSHLRVVVSSGSPLPPALATEFMDAFGDILYNFYGSTEVSQATVASPADLRANPTTAGHPALGTTVAILDPDGLTVPRGAIGRIFVRNDMLFDGYTDGGAPDTAESMMDTGDLGYLDADGRLFVCGRNDEMIISGGENVFPRPVEDALAALPQVSEVAVVGVPDEEYGERLAAFIVPKPGSRLDPAMVRSYINHRLTRSSVPRDVTFLNRLPRNTTGKVVKRLLVDDVS